MLLGSQACLFQVSFKAQCNYILPGYGSGLLLPACTPINVLLNSISTLFLLNNTVITLAKYTFPTLFFFFQCIELSSQRKWFDKRERQRTCHEIVWYMTLILTPLPIVMVLWKEIFLQNKVETLHLWPKYIRIWEFEKFSGLFLCFYAALSQLISISLFLQGEGGW